MKAKAGFTLLEVLVVLIVLALGSRIFAKTFLEKAARRADKSTLKALLVQASRKSLIENTHYGIHYDSTSKVVGLFKDQNSDETFNTTDTLASGVKLNTRAVLKMTNSDGASVKDLCFKKNGATSTGKSYSITYKGVGKDTFALQIIAASGQLVEL